MNCASRWSLVSWCSIGLALSVLPALAMSPGTVEPLRTAPEVALSTTEGAEFRLSQQRGQVVVMVFGYTHCPDVCPMTLARLAQLRARLGPAAAGVRVVFVTLDSERDSAARVRAYTRAFDPTFVALTGSPRALAQVRDAYGVIAGRRAAVSSAAYLVDHSTFVFVVDRAGQLRFMFTDGTSVDEMTQGIATLLH
jgi:protein SCO1